LLSSLINAQSHIPDEAERNLIKKAAIKAKIVHEINPNQTSQQDTGFGALEFYYNKEGQLVYFTRHHVFPELSVSESYVYSKGLPVKLSKINSLGDVFLEINYAFNKQGKLKKEEYVNYLNTVQTPFYFSILANVQDDSVFGRLQDELGIEPKLEAYSLTVNISDPDEENQYVIIGDEKDPNGIQHPWSLLSPETQRALLAWTGLNKTVHNVKTEYIETIEYRNDKNGNRLSKKVYNTSGDIVSNEKYAYTSKGKLSERIKYNSKDRIILKESYDYDIAGNLTGITSGSAKTDYKFSEDGRIVERISYSGRKTTGKDVYTYDVTGNIESITGYDALGSVYMKVSNQYNEKGLLKEAQYYDSGGKRTKIVKYTYEYHY